ncbi:hypothetical protein BJ684DRAFT_15728 [Piptocephalis cylindrospora]|uniref:DNA endonuclease activator Ctp1 C-terminal domain-containing protein n=1 Tax=Piptocephalis cylindrospora TaxID=1907219 RepID=A0A4P9Y4P9_9FUNG|nr:hypothetical protein BJ684DRAFT_15728 [Piptocephalis cylindrospora]|eukprot:RKP13917.1 hypothetical protein BJ684DRAFT_15728 [Piptocephalis cylindrospora]
MNHHPDASQGSDTQEANGTFLQAWLQVNVAHQRALQDATDGLVRENGILTSRIGNLRGENETFKREIARLQQQLVRDSRQTRPSQSSSTSLTMSAARTPKGSLEGPVTEREVRGMAEVILHHSKRMGRVDMDSEAKRMDGLIRTLLHHEVAMKGQDMSRGPSGTTSILEAWREVGRVCADQARSLREERDELERSRSSMAAFLIRKTEEWRSWRQWHLDHGAHLPEERIGSEERKVFHDAKALTDQQSPGQDGAMVSPKRREDDVNGELHGITEKDEPDVEGKVKGDTVDKEEEEEEEVIGTDGSIPCYQPVREGAKDFYEEDEEDLQLVFPSGSVSAEEKAGARSSAHIQHPLSDPIKEKDKERQGTTTGKARRRTPQDSVKSPSKTKSSILPEYKGKRKRQGVLGTETNDAEDPSSPTKSCPICTKFQKVSGPLGSSTATCFHGSRVKVMGPSREEGMSSVSRHKRGVTTTAGKGSRRNKRSATPEGFWDADFPPTQPSPSK